MKYRSRTDIVATILDAAKDGSTRTKIMYKAYLSYTQLKEYLSILVENGLMEYEEGQLKYKTTEKGFHYMRSYNEIGEMVSPEK